MTIHEKPGTATDTLSVFHRGDRLRKAREHAGYGPKRKKEFAELLEIDRGTMNKYEAGEPIKKSVLVSWSWHTRFAVEWLDLGTGPIFSDDGSDGPDGTPGEVSEKLRFDN